jgi:putative endopeptidase
MIKKLTALFMAFVMFAALTVPAFANEAPTPATRGEIVTTLLAAADVYNSGINKEAVIKGYVNGELKEKEPVKKIEALVMLSRAFGELPEPVGHDLRSGTFGLEFTDVPAWAKNDIDKLSKAGVLTAKPDGTLGVNDPITTTEFQTIVARVWALEGSHLNDDFYETINKDWLNASSIPAGGIMNGGIFELHEQNNDKIEKIVEDLVGKSFEKGTKEQKLADYYATALDSENRNKQGIEPIKKYLSAIDGAKTLEELVQADLILEKDLGVSTLFKFAIMGDAKNSKENALHYIGMTTGLDKASFVTEDTKAKEAYLNQLTKLLILTGEAESAAKAHAEMVYEMEKSLATVSLEPYEQGDVNKFYNPYTIEQFDDLLQAVDMKQALKSMKYDNVDKVIVMDVKLAQKGAEFMTDANLETLKAYSKVQLFASTGEFMSDAYTDIVNEFAAAMYGSSGQQTDEQFAIGKTKAIMSGYLEQMFAEKHFSAEAKKDVEQMADKLIAMYKERIKSLDWMSETTKAKAIKKLDTMTVKVGYPDKWDTTLDHIAIKTYDEGGSLFSNSFAVTKANLDNMKASLSKPIDKSKWSTSVYTVNAFYNSANNDITLPAGILQAPFYDINAKPEANLGGIGVTIGHEISHAFDNNGAAFDENGNANNWWTEEDFKKFEEKCQRLVEFYTGIEIVPGVTSNGLLTLSESVSDLGGMAAALQAVSEMSNPDYKVFFEANAKVEKTTTTKEFAAMLSANASHPAGKIRVNRSVVNFPEFYETYGIKPGDGMYVAPEDRVSIW